MHFDEILMKVGGWGKYQKVQFVLLGMLAVLPGFQNLCMVFIGGGDHRHWCHVPELKNLSATQQRYIAIPKTVIFNGESVYQECKMFDINFGSFTEDDYKTWNRTERTPDGTKTKQCSHGWDFDTTQYKSTIASQFNLVCSRAWMVTMATSIYMAGFMIGCLAFGAMSDRFGRHLTIYVCILLQFLFGLVATFSPFYSLFVITRALVAATASGAYTTGFVITVEILGPKPRAIYTIIFQGFFAVGYMLLPLFAFFVRNHRWLQLIMLAPMIPMVSYWWLIPESPRWLISEGRYDDALRLLNKIARTNGKPELEAGFFDKEKMEEENQSKERQSNQSDKHGSIIGLLSYPRLRRKTFNVFFNWFVNSIVYYGISFTRDLFGDNLYINTFVVAAVEIPALVMTVFLLAKWGRRWPLSLTMIGGGLACFLSIPFIYNEALGPALITMVILGKLGICSSFAIIYLYSSELFPTVVRNVGVGAGSMHARVAGLLAPQVADLTKYWVPLPSVIYGSFALVGGLLALLLPETFNRDLPETLEEGEEFVRKCELCKKKEDERPLTEASISTTKDK